MLSIGFSEILVIVTIGLIVIGPSRLPATARHLGHLFSRLQRQVSNIKADIRRQIDLEEVQSIQHSYQRQAKQTLESIKKTQRTIEKDITSIPDNPNNSTNDKNNTDANKGENAGKNPTR